MIPIIDIQKCGLLVPQNELKPEDNIKIGRELCNAFENVGFAYLINHGISEKLVNRTKEVSKEFFKLSPNVKQRYTRSKCDTNFGYSGLELEQLNPERPGDLKEAFDLTPKDEEQQKWPDTEAPELRNVVWEMFDAFTNLSYRLLRVIGIGLGLEDPALLVKYHQEINNASATTFRTLYYPPLPNQKDIKEKQIRCGEHSDYGTFTLLFQDQVGGLEVMNREGEYVAAVPAEGALVVNVGDLLQRWTADRLVSTMHRVLIPETELKRQEARQSLVYFLQPDDAKMIECLDGSNKYPPISALDYVNQRFADTYGAV